MMFQGCSFIDIFRFCFFRCFSASFSTPHTTIPPPSSSSPFPAPFCSFLFSPQFRDETFLTSIARVLWYEWKQSIRAEQKAFQHWCWCGWAMVAYDSSWRSTSAESIATWKQKVVNCRGVLFGLRTFYWNFFLLKSWMRTERMENLDLKSEEA